ncbi:MAG: hypothetical protein QOJ01_404, partial [Solirubrobacterales bacterium]|nr:hypothetical protein [Solirubrobacterales bacterium]
ASQHVVRAVVSLANGFHLDTVAEGVEDAESYALLKEYGVTNVQGYHIARPGPIAAVLRDPGPWATANGDQALPAR